MLITAATVNAALMPPFSAATGEAPDWVSLRLLPAMIATSKARSRGTGHLLQRGQDRAAMGVEVGRQWVQRGGEAGREQAGQADGQHDVQADQHPDRRLSVDHAELPHRQAEQASPPGSSDPSDRSGRTTFRR